jgi:uncharacterized repeat protein (TIGR01451 family)
MAVTSSSFGEDFTASTTFNITVGLPVLPDLVVTALTGPNNVTSGSAINVSSTVLNQGSGSAGAFRVEFYFSLTSNVSLSTVIDTTWGCPVASLAPGASQSCSGPVAVPASLTPGIWYLAALADSNNQVVESNENNNWRIADTGPVTVTPQGATFLQLTSATSRDWFPVWRPDGTKILFSSNRTNIARANDVWDMNPDGSQQRELIHVDITTPASWGDPGLAANTKEFIGSTGDLAIIEQQDYWEVMRVGLSAATFFPIMRTAWDGPDTYFSDLLLVPGGLTVNSFAYSNATNNAAWLHVDGGQRQVVRTAPFSQLSGQSCEATGTVLFTTSSDSAAGGLAFAPNGQQLVASLCVTSCSALHKGTDLYLLDATTGQVVQRLTTDGDAGISSYQPHWSPDGRWMAFISNKSGDNEIWIMHSDGTGAKQITSNGSDNSGPSWSPDSKSLVFATNNSGTYSIWLASLQLIGTSPVLSITLTHSGTFTQGQTNATYAVTVSNGTSAGSASGTVKVTETVPAGMTLVSMAGSGWTCPSGGNTCTRSDSLFAGSSYPPITVTVNVAANATSPQVNQVSVSGGGSATASASDSTIITASGHPAFFTGEVALANSVYSLQLADGNPFGYYGYLASGWIYHFDLGYVYVFAGNGPEVYLWDMSSGHWWYTNTSQFPYLYDFTLHAWLYYFPDTHNAGHYTTNPRYFVNMSTSQIFTM